MTTFVFLFRELLGSIRSRSAVYLLMTGLLILVFLGSFASLFLFVSPAKEVVAKTPSEIRIWLSPRLATSQIDELYDTLRRRAEVEAIHYQFAQVVEQGQNGGLFVVSLAPGIPMDTFFSEIEATEGVMRVETPADSAAQQEVSLAASIRVALLLGLAISAGLSLISGRLGFRRLLEDFAGEIRLLRISGIAQKAISPAIVALGLLLGLLSALLVVTAIALLHFSLAGNASVASVQLIQGGRVAVILVVDFLLGAIMGSLVGLLGSSLLGRREFSPLP